MRILRLVLLSTAILYLFGFALFAQKSTAGDDDNFLPDFKSDKDMKMLIAEKTPFVPSYGGWITSDLIDEKSKDASGARELFTSITTARIWLKSYLWGNNFVYVRGKDVYLHVLKEKITDIDNSDNVLDLDVGFFSFSNKNNTLKIFLGRKFFNIGTGLVFNGRGDGGELDYYSKFLDVKLFGAYTGLMKKDNNPYGLSDKDISTGAKRVFAGGTLSQTIFNQTIFLLGLMQIDKGKEGEWESISSGTRAGNLVQKKSRYQSQYYGAGLKGIAGDAFYYAEFIIEKGESNMLDYDDYGTVVIDRYKKKSVKAYACNAGLNYYFDMVFKPTLLINYAYGSGDKDRSDYKSPTGNTTGDDKGFIYFGTYIGGYALRPILANLHIFRGGFSIVPFSKSNKKYLKRIGFTAKYSYYMKDLPSSLINYGEANLDSKDVGHGIDSSVRCKIFYDLAIYVNYGLFIPGDAYLSSEKNRNFIMGGVYLTF